MKETPLPAGRCPFCTGLLDAVTSLEEATPSPGDLTVCLYCASPLRLDDDLILRVLSPEEMRELAPETVSLLRSIMRAVRKLDRRKAGGGRA